MAPQSGHRGPSSKACRLLALSARRGLPSAADHLDPACTGGRATSARPTRRTHRRGSDFDDPGYEWRRLFAEALGTFFLVLAAVGGGMVDARFGGNVVPLAAQATAPGLLVGAVILSMGAVSGAHLNPGVSIAFALRGDFPWRRVPAYVAAQFAGAILATLLLVALLGRQGTAGLTLPGPGISDGTAMVWELVLSIGLVTTILGTASGAQNVGPMNAVGVASYIVVAGLFGAPVSGASMNVARSLGPVLILGDTTAWWVYLVGPLSGAVVAVGIAHLLRGPGGGYSGTKAAQGTLGWLWRPGPIEPVGPPEEANAPDQAISMDAADPH
jgi:aquaporin Z